MATYHADCVSGETAIAGGYATTNSDFNANGAYPSGSSKPTGWQVTFNNENNSVQTVTVYVICAT